MVVHGVGSNLALVRRILPLWRPAMVLDTLSLARRAWLASNCGLGALDEAVPDTGAYGAADRASATARLLMRLADALRGLGFTERQVPHQA